MGEVFRAEDTVLGRVVAVKVLPAEMVATPERRLRFEQEARLTASLSHPNVVQVHDVGEAGGIPYVVQEFVDGESLEDVLGRGAPLPGQVVAWCAQAAEGLAAAHDAGILHRDVKPGNLLLGRDGRIRIVDFGLATLDPARSGAQARPGLTVEGVVLGTPHYMSPEQAAGRKLDGRTDVFSLGVVLYEMLTGARPFEGDSAIDVLHAIVHEPYAPTAEGATALPATLAQVVDRSLKKKPDDRYASAREMAEALEQILEAGELPGTPPRRRSASPTGTFVPTAGFDSRTQRIERSRPSRGLFAAAAGIGALAVAGLVALLLLRRAEDARPPVEPPRPVQVTTWSGLDVFPAFTPDGGSLVYCSNQSGKFEIYRRSLAPGGKEIALTGDGQENLQPAVSPDGGTVAYHSKKRGGIWLVPAVGGTPRQLSSFGSRPAYSPDGAIVVFETDPVVDLSASAYGALPPSVLWTVASGGGRPAPLTEAGRPAGGHGAPNVSPDGEWVAFSVYSRDRAEIWALSLKTRNLVEISGGKGWRLDPVWGRSGDEVYYGGVSDAYTSGLYRRRFDAKSGKPVGEEQELANFGSWRTKHVALSPDGKSLAYSSLQMSSNLWLRTLDPATAMPVGEATRLTQESGRNSRPAFSPDGTTIAFSKWRLGSTQDIWTVDLLGKNPVQRTTDPADDDFPEWLPGGERLAFVSRRGGKTALWTVDLKTGHESLLADPGTDVDFIRLSQDGRRYSFHSARGGRTFNVFVGEVGGGPARQITFDSEMAGFASWSPDGKRLAIEVKRGEHVQVGVVSSDGGPIDVITSEPGQSWPYSFSPDGDKIAFVGLRDGIWNAYWVSTSTRKIVKLSDNERISAYLRYVEWSPTGDRVVSEFSETTGNVWMLTNLR